MAAALVRLPHLLLCSSLPSSSSTQVRNIVEASALRDLADACPIEG